MSFRNTFSLLICLSVFGQSVIAQDTKARLVDEFASNLCSDDFRGRIDLFLASISNEPKSTGRIVITPDRRMPGRSIKYEKMISAHIAFRRFDPNSIVISRKPIGDSSIQFWIIPGGSGSNSSESDSSFVISNTTLFDASWIASVKARVVEFGEPWGNEPCDFGLFPDQYASALQANPELMAHLVAVSDKRIGRSRVERALRFTVENLTAKYGIAAERIETSYAGKRKDAEMQFWLVPKGGIVPVFKEDATEW